MLPAHNILPAPAVHARQPFGVINLLLNSSVILGSSTITSCIPGVNIPSATGIANPADDDTYTTVYTTAYIQVCPTETPCAKGTKTETFTITETCTGNQDDYITPVIPPNFTTVVEVCTACEGKPTVTVTCPIPQQTSPTSPTSPAQNGGSRNAVSTSTTQNVGSGNAVPTQNGGSADSVPACSGSGCPPTQNGASANPVPNSPTQNEGSGNIVPACSGAECSQSNGNSTTVYSPATATPSTYVPANTGSTREFKIIAVCFGTLLAFAGGLL